MTSEATAMAEEIIVGSANLEAIRIRIKAIQGGGPSPTGLWVRRFSNQACRQPHWLRLRRALICETGRFPTRDLRRRAANWFNASTPTEKPIAA